MAATKTPIATDSATALRDLVGDDVTAEFESDPAFIGSNPFDRASSEHMVLRDTDDIEDSEEEDEEFDEDGVDEDDEDEEDEDEDEDSDEEDDAEELGSIVMQAA